MTDYRLRMLMQGVTSWLIVIAAVVLAVQGSISGSDAMVVLIGTAGTSAGAVAAIGRDVAAGTGGPQEVAGDAAKR